VHAVSDTGGPKDAPASPYGRPARDTSTFLALVLKHAAVRNPTSKKHEMLADYTARVSTSIIRNTALMVRSYRQRCAGG